MIRRDMKVCHFSIAMMCITLINGAPQRRCITRNKESKTDDSGRVVIHDNKNHNNDGKDKDPTENTVRPRKRCCPYDFDSQKCQIINDRKVCGYNTNNGGPDDNPAEQTLRLANGCWFRRGRFECGYQGGPYTGIRRPPVYDITPAPTATTIQEEDEYQINDEDDSDAGEKLIYGKSTVSPLIRPKTVKPTTLPSCVKIQRKIVCGVSLPV